MGILIQILCFMTYTECLVVRSGIHLIITHFMST